MNKFCKYILVFYLCGLAGLAELIAGPVRIHYTEHAVVNKQRLEYALNKLKTATDAPAEKFQFGKLSFEKSDLVVGVLGEKSNWQNLLPAELLDGLKNARSEEHTSE